MIDVFHTVWPYLITALHLTLATMASVHILLNKRDPGAAVAWMGLVWLSPFIGVLGYFVFGINRIHRKAANLNYQDQHQDCPPEASTEGPPVDDVPLAQFINRVVKTPLESGNAIVCYRNGDEAFPAMLEAIGGAQKSVTMSTYIFDNDSAGKEFVSALSAAQARGVAVRVLIDGVGSHYSSGSTTKRLQKAGITCAQFLPASVPWYLPVMNLRNHRKILVVDGKIGFTGGMNIREGNLVQQSPKHAIQDLHFRVMGPVVPQLQSVFAADWDFASKEPLSGDTWFSTCEHHGNTWARGIADGPDRKDQEISWTLTGAVTMARHSVRILSPYFLPDTRLTTALSLAALRGVDVSILLPADNNLPFVKWASTASVEDLLDKGCHIAYSKPPFDHSKLMIVDDQWVLFGSANLDPRSLRLNFEFCVEAYDEDFAKVAIAQFEAKKANSTPASLEKILQRPLIIRLRDGITSLLTPYL